jgi:hypothetical protein
MRKPTPAYLVTCVVIALGGSLAFAQTTVPRTTMPTPTASAGTSTTTTPTTRGSMVNNGTFTRTPNGAITTTNVNGGTTTTNANGSTITTNRNADGTFTSVTRNSDGSVASTITTNGAPSFDANGVLVTDTTTGTSVAPIEPTPVNPVVNGAIGGVTVDGERLLDERDRVLQIDRGTVSAGVQAQPGTALADVQRSSVSLDRVIKAAEQDRKKIGRNGQLLNSIAPRTNVDRSNEMPDDGPTPALSGLSNSLRR